VTDKEIDELAHQWVNELHERIRDLPCNLYESWLLWSRLLKWVEAYEDGADWNLNEGQYID
jgi:hypothetical protein